MMYATVDKSKKTNNNKSPEYDNAKNEVTMVMAIMQKDNEDTDSAIVFEENDLYAPTGDLPEGN